jgi:3',5'-cyclic AMP phosphodiesterase CpdA
LTVLISFLIVVVLVTGAVFIAMPRQVHSYLTHWKGSPTHTVAYGPYPIPGDPTLRMAVAGDIGDSGPRLDRTAAAIERLAGARGWDALLLLGDNVYPNGDPKQLPKTVFEPFGPILDAVTRLLAILGNHDVKKGNGPGQVKALGMPGRWWSTEVNGVLIVGLDSNVADDPAQRTWLERTLRDSKAAWTIVALHHPPYSAGYQGSSLKARAAFSPLFERYGVQLVLSGHDHDYQRSKPINGVTYIVSGAGAGTRRTGTASFTADSFSWHHFLEVAVFADRLVVRAVNQDDRVADQAVIPR